MEMAAKLVHRGIARLADDEEGPYEMTAEYAQQVQRQKAKEGGCCPEKRK